MIYFRPPFNPKSVDAQFKFWAKRLHPDKGGSEKLFKELQTEKAEALKKCDEVAARKKTARPYIPKQWQIPKRKPVVKKHLTVDFRGVAELLKQLSKLK